MIGRIEFDTDRGRVTATLEDDKRWTCDDPVALWRLMERATPSPGYLPRQEQLYAASFLPGYTILEESPTEDPEPGVVY